MMMVSQRFNTKEEGSSGHPQTPSKDKTLGSIFLLISIILNAMFMAISCQIANLMLHQKLL